MSWLVSVVRGLPMSPGGETCAMEGRISFELERIGLLFESRRSCVWGGRLLRGWLVFMTRWYGRSVTMTCFSAMNHALK